MSPTIVGSSFEADILQVRNVRYTFNRSLDRLKIERPTFVNVFCASYPVLLGGPSFDLSKISGHFI